MALALIHGCPGPRYFAASLVDYIFEGECRPLISEIPDEELSSKLIELSTADKELFQCKVKVLDERFDCGYDMSIPLSSMKKRKNC